MSDKEKLAKVFEALQESGVVARMQTPCCQSCSWAALEKEEGIGDDDDVLFYHDQDAAAFGSDDNLRGTLYLSHQGDAAKMAVPALRHAGFDVDWDGTEATRVGVNHG